MSKTVLIAVASLLIVGFFAVSQTAIAHDASPYPYQRHYSSAWLYAPGDYDGVGRGNTDYYFTSSPFCPPDSSNAYNGDFATLAYGADGRAAGYVCR
jgi:hypothetical protein